MECDQIVVVCIALLLVNVSISVCESSEKNVSAASVKLDFGLPRFRTKNPAEWFKTDYVRYSSDVPQNYTNCSGLQVISALFFSIFGHTSNILPNMMVLAHKLI